MQIFRGIKEFPSSVSACVASIGNFDGLHLGHRELIARLLLQARKKGLPSVVVSFQPHPQIALRPGKLFELINSANEKAELLASTGIDIFVEEPFGREFSNQTANDFIQNYIVSGLRAKALLLGYDFSFGRGREGTVPILRDRVAGMGIEVEEVAALVREGIPVSSSRVRNALDQGDVTLARELLSRAFFVEGLVVRGNGRGRTIQVPTANLRLEPRKLPKRGVYATRTRVGHTWYYSVTNIGLAPTFQQEGEAIPALTVETHLLDFTADLYGQSLRVEFMGFIREERKFVGPNELVAQIRKDISEARLLLAKH